MKKRLILAYLYSFVCINMSKSTANNDFIVRHALTGGVVPRDSVAFVRIDDDGEVNKHIDFTSLPPGFQNRMFAFNNGSVAHVVINGKNVDLVMWCPSTLDDVCDELDKAFKGLMDDGILGSLKEFVQELDAAAGSRGVMYRTVMDRSAYPRHKRQLELISKIITGPMSRLLNAPIEFKNRITPYDSCEISADNYTVYTVQFNAMDIAPANNHLDSSLIWSRLRACSFCKSRRH